MPSLFPLNSSKGEQWRQLRYAVNKQLVPRSVMNLTNTLLSVSDDLVSAVKTSRGPVMELNNLYDYLTLWAFEGNSEIKIIIGLFIILISAKPYDVPLIIVCVANRSLSNLDE